MLPKSYDLLSLAACTPVTATLKCEEMCIIESVKQGLASGAKASLDSAGQASLPRGQRPAEGPGEEDWLVVVLGLQ